MKHYHACLWLILSLAYTPQLYADTATTTFTVSASVADNCAVSADPLVFGSYDAIAQNNALDGTTTVSVTCTSGTTYSVGLSAGLGSGATPEVRLMTRTSGGSETLQYTLYQPDTTTVWDDNTRTVPGTGSGAAQDLTVYGTIAAGQSSIPVGSYQDTITVTVTY